MNASRSFAAALHGAGGMALELPVAALAGIAVATAAFAVPSDLLAELVAASRLDAMIAAAEPPLGLKARIALGASGAIAMSAITFLLLRSLDRLGSRSRPVRMPEPVARIEPEAPRLRRRDRHPDAKPRSPLLAGRELGEPTEPEARRVRPPEAAEETAPAEAGATPPVAIARAPLPVTIDELMARFERGLARRVAPVADAPGAPQDPRPAAFPDPSDDRLQSAIDNLQRLAARQG